MTDRTSTLYAKLLGETAQIDWKALEPFFARGALLWVEPPADLIEVAQTLAEDKAADFAALMESGAVSKLSSDKACDLQARNATVWAVVVQPWIVIQERAEG